MAVGRRIFTMLGEEIPTSIGYLDLNDTVGSTSATNQAAIDRIFPDSKAWAGSPPCVHHIAIGSWFPGEPLEQISDEGYQNLVHVCLHQVFRHFRMLLTVF